MNAKLRYSQEPTRIVIYFNSFFIFPTTTTTTTTTTATGTATTTPSLMQ